MIKKKLLLGAHMSVAGGYEQAIVRGASIGCTTIQIFTKSNRQWNAAPITPEQVTLYDQIYNEYDISPVVAHASYLINLATADDQLRKKSIAGLKLELDRCHLLQIPYLVLHPGTATGQNNIESALSSIIESLNEVLHAYTGTTMILLENMAGQGSSVCADITQLAHIRKNIKDKKHVAYALDTCHAFAAGYNFSTKATYRDFCKLLDDTLGIHLIKAIHLNDSKKPCGSRVDRHEDIGKGAIGLEAFACIMNDDQFADVPKILETPQDTLEDYARNMEVLKKLLR